MIKGKYRYCKMGGQTAFVAREDIEKKLGESIISKDNKLNYEYMDDDILKINNIK